MTYESRILSLSPTAYLPFTEAAGSSFADATGNGHTGSIADATVVAGGTDGPISDEKACQLQSATSGEVDLDATGFSVFGAAFSYEWWARFDWDADVEEIAFLNLRVASGDFSHFLHIQTFINRASGSDFFVNLGTLPTGITAGCAINRPGLRCWHHYALTWDGTQLRIYCDGIAQTVTQTGAAPGAFTPTGAAIWVDSVDTYPAAYINHVAHYPAALSAGDVAANFAAATPRQDAACFLDTIRQVHRGGIVDFEHDSTTFRVRSNDVTVLQTPLATLDAPPHLLMGQDPATLLPAYCPAPTAQADMPVTPPAPTVADNCTQVRCGVSSQCVNHLSSLNTNWAHWLGPLLAVVGTVAFAAVLANVIDPLFDLEVGGALASSSATWELLRPYVIALTTSISGGFLPSLTPDMIEAIQQPLFCALTCEGGVVSPTPAQIATWRSAVAGLAVFIPGTLTQVLLDALLAFTPLQDWQVQAQQATPLSTCDEWTCP